MSMFSMMSCEGDAGLGGGLLEGVEVDDDHVDGLDAVRVDGGDVLGVAADVEDAAVDVGVEGLDAAVEHLGEAGEVGDVADFEAGVAEGVGGAAGGDELDAVAGEGAGEVDEAGLVGDGEEGAADGFEVGLGGGHVCKFSGRARGESLSGWGFVVEKQILRLWRRMTNQRQGIAGSGERIGGGRLWGCGKPGELWGSLSGCGFAVEKQILRLWRRMTNQRERISGGWVGGC